MPLTVQISLKGPNGLNITCEMPLAKRPMRPHTDPRRLEESRRNHRALLIRDAAYMATRALIECLEEVPPTERHRRIARAVDQAMEPLYHMTEEECHDD